MKNIISLLVILLIISEVKAQNVDFTTYSKNTMAGIKYGAISVSGDTLLKADYDQIYKFNGKYFIVRKGNYSGIVDTNGKVIIPLKYGALTNIVDGRLFVGNGGKYALADAMNKLLTGYLYDNVWSFSEGIAKVKIGDYFGYINKSGLTVIPIKFIEGSDYCKYGKVVVQVRDWKDLGNYKVTYITGYSTDVNAGYSTDCPVVFNKDGVILHRGTNSWEKVFILSNGNLLITNYDVKNCSKDVFEIKDSKGKILFGYDQCCEVGSRYDSCMIVYSKRAGKKGIIDNNGKIIVPLNFQDITDFTFNGGNYSRVYFDDKTFFYTDFRGRCQEFDGVKCPQ